MRFLIHFGDGFSHGRSLEFETVCVVNDAIEYGVGERRLEAFEAWKSAAHAALSTIGMPI
jgi:hypothetical protein